jgi:hypothetical protein
MTYRKFIVFFPSSLKGKTVFLFDKGTEVVRHDVLYILEKRFKNQLASLKLKSFRRKMYNLADIKDNPFAILVNSTYTLIIVEWEKGILDDKKTKAFLRGCRDSGSRFAILDPYGEVRKVWKEVFPKASSGQDVDCGLIPSDLKGRRSAVGGRLWAVGIDISEEVAQYLAMGDDMSSERLFNTFYILEALGEKVVDTELLRKHSLIVPNIEYHLMRVLFDRGKLAFLSQPNVDYDDGRLLRYIIRELILMLKCKTVRGATDQKKSGMVGLDYSVFLDYKKRVEKVELTLLYRRLYTAFMTLRYGGLKGSTLLFLSNW